MSHPLDDPDAIVSLSSHEWERLPLTARLALKHPAALVILTFPQTVTLHNCHECNERVARLVAAGIAPDRIHVLPLTEAGTYGEATACRQFLSGAPRKELLVVTSPYHTRRALAVFRAVFHGTDTQIGVEPASEFSSARPGWWWLSSYDRWYVAYEWAAIVYYAGKYRILLHGPA